MGNLQVHVRRPGRPRREMSSDRAAPHRTTSGALICEYTKTGSGTDPTTGKAYILADSLQPIAGWSWKQIKIWGNNLPIKGWAILVSNPADNAERWVLFSDNSCSPKYQLSVVGNPQSGTFVARLRAKDSGGAWVTQDLTFQYNMTAAQIVTLIETHPEIEAGKTVVTGGPLTGPIGASSNVTITLPSNAMFGNGVVTIVSLSLVKSGLLDPAVALNECCS